MKRLVIIAALLVAFLNGAALLGWKIFLDFVSQPGEVTTSARKIVIATDSSVEMLSEILKREQLVTRSGSLKIYLKHFRVKKPYIPGEYELSGLMSPAQILDQIQSGKVVTYAIAIEPGRSAKKSAQSLEEKGFGDAQALLARALDADFAQSLNIEGDRLEGYLFPDTYELSRKLESTALLKILVARFREKVSPAIIAEAKKLGLSLHQLVIIASLIESERVPPEELRMVSSVFHNRLKQKLKLEHPASLAYGLDKPESMLAPSDREIENGWNTYLKSGLPATPIGSPGLKAIMAAARPSKSDALYFAPRNDTSHIFCPDRECHEIAMRRWRESQRKSDIP